MLRRLFLVAALAAPAIIRTPGLLMPVRKIIVPESPAIFTVIGGLEVGETVTLFGMPGQYNGTYTVVSCTGAESVLVPS